MIYHSAWVLGVMALTAFIAFTRFQADVENEELQNNPKYHRAYEAILADLNAEIRTIVPSDKHTGYRSTTFKLGACDDDYVIYEVRVTQSLPQVFSKPPINRQQMRILYFDHVWTEWSRFKSTLLALKISFASVFGLTPFDPSKKLLILTIPAGCNSLDEIDWSKVWVK